MDSGFKVEVDDLAPVYSLAPTLESLSLIAGSRSRVDLARLPKLTYLAADWPQVASSIGSATKLTDLYLGLYSDPDLAPLQPLTRLVSLRMKDGPYLESLDGLSAYPALRRLDVAGAELLRDFDALSSKAPQLEDLSLNSCKQLRRLDAFSNLRLLQRLDLGNCGPIESLAPIGGLLRLRDLFLTESTRVEDNDLSPLLALPALVLLGIKSRREYRPDVATIQASITARAAAVE